MFLHWFKQFRVNFSSSDMEQSKLNSCHLITEMMIISLFFLCEIKLESILSLYQETNWLMWHIICFSGDIYKVSIKKVWGTLRKSIWLHIFIFMAHLTPVALNRVLFSHFTESRLQSKLYPFNAEVRMFCQHRMWMKVALPSQTSSVGKCH